MNVIGRILNIRNSLMRSDLRIRFTPINSAQHAQIDDREFRTMTEEITHQKHDSGLDELITEPAIDNLGPGTVTDSAEVRQSEHTRYNSNISDTNEQSILNWQSFSLSDAYRERPPAQYIVGNILQLPSLSIVYGSPGSFKSFLLADLACCVASGKDWLPPYGDPIGEGKPITQVGVIWVDFDNGQLRTLDRFKVLGTAMDLPEDVPLKIYSMPFPGFDARDPIQITELQVIIEAQNAKLIIFDNLAMISGDADENSAEMAKIFYNLRRLSDATNTAIVVIHHPRKGSPDQNRMGESLRGHSSIEAAIDLALYMDRSGDNLPVEIIPTKVRDSLVEPFFARFDFEVDQNDQLIKSRFYSSTGSLDNQTVMVMEAIWETLADGDFNKGALTLMAKELLKDTDAKNVGINQIVKIINGMHDKGFLLMNIGKNNSRIFSRNPDKPYERFLDREGDSTPEKVAGGFTVSHPPLGV